MARLHLTVWHIHKMLLVKGGLAGHFFIALHPSNQLTQKRLQSDGGTRLASIALKTDGSLAGILGGTRASTVATLSS
ncbi:MAG: hypothetical protein WBM11_00280 [Terriglobales bacterium]